MFAFPSDSKALHDMPLRSFPHPTTAGWMPKDSLKVNRCG